MSQFGKEIKKLGFGFMRLPMLEDGEHTDIEQVKQMVDQFMEAGCTYFDTAYVYGKDGESEKAMRAALVERYPREKYTIATKLNAWLACDSEEEAKQMIDITSCLRIGICKKLLDKSCRHLLHKVSSIVGHKVVDDVGCLDDGVARGDGPVGLDLEHETVVVGVATDAAGLDVLGATAHRRIQRHVAAEHGRSACGEFPFQSLERLGTDYVDFYLLHAIQDNNWQRYEEWHLWEYMEELKEKGLIKHWGFSFHATPELLEETLTKHPGAEFVQLQINYADMENPAVQSRACYEVACAHEKPVVVMEPVKGGTLAAPPTTVAEVFDKANAVMGVDFSYASWAIRYAASLDNVMVVLSGMSNLEQMEDNLSFMRHFDPLDLNELGTVGGAQLALKAIDQINCTACHYCMPGCPMNIPIPDFFEAMNWHKIYGNTKRAKFSYGNDVKQAGVKASDCIACGQCEGACPQKLPIISLLEEVAATLED